MKEKGRGILKKAINHLPEFQRNSEDLWNKIDNELEKGERTISTGIQYNLPEYIAPEGIWPTIENKLNEIPLENALNKLPEYHIPVDLWPDIEQKLDAPNKNNHRKIYLTLVKIAALFILLIGSSLIFRAILNYSDRRGTISYSLEIIDEETMPSNKDLNNKNRDEHIQIICRNNPIVCSTPQFLELNKQIEDVSIELETISKILQQDRDPQVMKYYYQLENEKVEIEKKIIKVLNQS